MIDRSIAPPTYKIKKCKLTSPDALNCNTNGPIYILNSPSQPVVQIDLIFESGSFYEKKTGVANFTASMILEGTKKLSYNDIAEKIDYFGASVETNVGLDYLTISIKCLAKFSEEMIGLLKILLQESIFPEERIKHLKSLKKTELEIDNLRTSKVSEKKLRNKIFSNGHPYGSYLKESDVDNITREDILEFYENNLTNSPKAFVSGEMTNLEHSNIVKGISEIFKISQPEHKKFIDIPISSPSMDVIKIENSLQASICIGKVLFTKRHTDYFDFFILNTILGGYFGSRLMSNIREKMGCTYGIYSGIAPLKYSGYFFLKAEVGSKHIEKVLTAIDNELILLFSKEIDKSELKTVKNYITGFMKEGLHNPIHLMTKIKSAYLFGLDESYYETLYEAMSLFNKEKAIEISKKYLQPNSMTKIIVN